MKKFLAVILTLVVAGVVLAGCGGGPEPAAPGGDGGGATTPAVTTPGGKTEVRIMSFTTELSEMLPKFLELNPDIDAAYEFVSTVVPTEAGAYRTALDAALVSGTDAPDIYAAESAFVLRYTQGEMARFAAPYTDLGIDLGLVSAADIAQYTVDVGTRPADNALVGLGFQATGSAMIYRRSIAREVFGTDDPAVIQGIVGPGWDRFLDAARELRAHGYSALSGWEDSWNAVRSGSDRGWLAPDGSLYIDPSRENMLDLAKIMADEDLTNGTQAWHDGWFADFSGSGAREAFAFLGPAWLINYVMSGNAGDTFGDWAICVPPVGFAWGGTWVMGNDSSPVKDVAGRFIEWVTLDTSDTGLQFLFANGILQGPGGTKDTVASGVVMARSDGTLDMLGGQDMFDVMIPAGAFARADNWTEFDEAINELFIGEVRNYVAGLKGREQALADFRVLVSDQLGID
ncbi:MAG: ABC transporter substrate-binding protein [Defluviitaleaceae bacterium]|nr:ABC transporter substrate-binding protein [Defluviitaleaceae bacterium]